MKCNAVVLKTADIGENDKLVWMFTDKFGKISTIAKGAKKSKSKFLSVTLPLCFGEYLVFKGKSLYNLSEGKIIDSFQEFLNDLTPLTYSSYLCELIDIAVVEEEGNIDLFKYFVSTLYIMKTGAVDYEILTRSFELKLLALTGYGMNFEVCTCCRKKISSSNYISMQYYGGVCENCAKDHGIVVSRTCYSALKFLNTVPLEKVYRVTLSREVKDELSKVLSILIGNNYSRRPKSLQMLEIIKECE